MNTGRVTDEPVRTTPDRVALVVGEREVTYAELEHLVRQTVTWLTSQGVGPGDRVAVVARGGALAVAAILASARMGAASAQLNVSLTVPEMRQLVDDIGARVGLAGDEERDRLAEAVDGPVATEDELAAVTPDTAEDLAIGEGDDEALVLFTSGTTGLPKPVFISHRVVWDRIRYYAEPLDPDAPQRVDMLSAPVFHIGGTLGLLLQLAQGKKMVVLPRFDAEQWLRQVERHRVEQTWLVPTMLQRILDHPRFHDYDTSSIISISYGAAASSPTLIRRALEAWPDADFMNSFGQTETLGAYAALLPDDHRRGLAEPHILGSVGKALPGVEVEIRDPDSGQPVPTGSVGQIFVRAPFNVVEDWLATGDLARRDDEGYLYIEGRISDTINRGGEKLGPIEVEDALSEHPAVVEAAVAPVADPDLGEEVGAAVVVRGAVTSDELREHCAARLASYKVPRYVVFVDELPRTNLGKVRRPEISALIRERLEAASVAGGA